MPTAGEIQVGGSHYKNRKIQPHEYSHANGLGWHEGEIVKYVTRHRDKGGRVDLEKLIHVAQLLLELEYSEKDVSVGKMIPCDDPQNITDEEIKDWITRLRQK